jgi:tetratricopeptide (TPR) repeat protein
VPNRIRRAFAPGVPFVLALYLAVVSGCGPSDPLERIREQQDVHGDFKSTLEPLRELVEKRPDDAEVHFRYGTALQQTGQGGLALWPLKRAMESPGYVKKAGAPLASMLIESGAYDDAIGICNQILEAEPDDVPTLLLRANARMLSHRDYEGSLADAEHVLEVEPENHDALIPRTVALLALNRIDDAAKAIDQLDSLYRDDSLGLHGNSSLCAARATFAKEKGELELAEQRFEACLKDFPTDGQMISATTGFFDEIEKPERATEILTHAVEQVPGSHSYRMALVLRLAGQGKDAEAEALLRKGTELSDPREAAECWAALGSFLIDRNRAKESVEAFEKAMAMTKGDSPQLSLAYADSLVIAGRFDDALALADKMSLASHQAMVRGRVALARGDAAGALKQFEEGMRLWPNNAVARYYTAVAAEQVGDFDRAVENYRYAMRINVGETDAYLRLARLHAAAGRYRAALTTLEFSQGERPDEVPAAILHMRILGRVGRAKQIPRFLRVMLQRPDHWGAGLAALGQGVRDHVGPKVSLELMRSAKPLQLDDPDYVEALAAICEDLVATGKSKEALALVDAGLRKHPDAAGFHAVRGRVLAISKAPVAEARASFERALAIDAKNERALLGLARLERDAGASDAAFALYDRATAADPDAADPAREAGALASAIGKKDDAEKRLTALLDDQPYDGEAARLLAELRFARGAKDERTIELARRAVTFGGGDEAKALLERVGGTPAKVTPDAPESPEPNAG